MTAAASPVTGSMTSLWDRPGYLVRRLHQIHVAIFLEECAAFGITPVQYAVMTALLNRPDSDQVTVASDAGIDRTNVADVLARLDQRGLVARSTSKTDRRQRIARLTPERRTHGPGHGTRLSIGAGEIHGPRSQLKSAPG